MGSVGGGTGGPVCCDTGRCSRRRCSRSRCSSSGSHCSNSRASRNRSSGSLCSNSSASRSSSRACRSSQSSQRSPAHWSAMDGSSFRLLPADCREDLPGDAAAAPQAKATPLVSVSVADSALVSISAPLLSRPYVCEVCGCVCLPSPCLLFPESLAFQQNEEAWIQYYRCSVDASVDGT